MDDFFRYRIYKGNINVITLGKEEANRKHGACVNDSLLDQCQQRYSLRYVNETYVSFRLSNLTLSDSGLYTLEAFFSGITHDPEYAEVYLTVQGNPFCKSICLSSFLFWAGTLQTLRRVDGGGLMVSVVASRTITNGPDLIRGRGHCFFFS